MRKWIVYSALGALLALTLGAPAGAVYVDPDYSGALDPYTGLPVTYAGGSERERVVDLGGCKFDRDKQRYVVEVGSSSFTASVPPGIILEKDGEVSVELPGQLTGTLYKNGDLVDQPDLSKISGVGSYLLLVRNASGRDEVQFSFTIQSGLTRSLVEYNLPSGFTFTSVSINGEDATAGYSSYIEFLEEGEYRLRYSCEEIGRSYSLTFTLDRTAPVLALPEVVEGEAWGPVTLADMEKGSWVQVECSGEVSQVTSPSTVLREPGRYTLTTFDQAGNSSSYSFILHFYLNFSAVTAIGLAAAAIGGLIFYSRWTRRHARVG